MTTYACETLRENAELTKENVMLKIQNKELLARCDLLEAELAQAKDQKKARERELAVLIDRLGE